MNQYEAADEIVRAIPEAKEEIATVVPFKTSYAIIQIFTRHIKRLIEIHNEVMVEKCLRIMDKIHHRGDAMLRNAVENIFVFALDSLTSSCDSSEKKSIMGIMPMGLYTIYINQFYKSGI